MLFWGSAALVDGLTPSEEVAATLKQQEMPPETLIASGFEEPSLVAYAQASWVYESDYKKAKELYEKAPKSALVALSEEFTLKNVPELLLRSPLHPARDNEAALLGNPPVGGRRFRMEGLNLGRFSWVTYDLYLKP
jgi:hypothetical protein